MENLTIFEFESQEVRLLVINDEPWWVGKDIARILGYSDLSQAIRQHCDDEDTLSDIELKKMAQELSQSNFNLVSRAIYINESGLYALIFGSTLSSAKKFKRWLTSEVLPSIRKTGNYGKPDLSQITRLEIAKMLVEAEEEKLILKAQNNALTEQIEQDAPLVEYAKKVQYSKSAIDFNSFAKMIGTGRTRLFRVMRDLNIIMKDSTLPYQRHIEAGYFEVSQEIVVTGQQSSKLVPFALVTPKGQLWLHGKVAKAIAIENGAVKAISQGVIFQLN